MSRELVIILSLVCIILLTNAVNLTYANQIELLTDDVEVISYQLAKGVYKPGEEVSSQLKFKSLTEDKTFYLGYSLRDSAGYFHDIPAKEVQLTKGETVELKQSWQVPNEVKLGDYDLYLVLWDNEPSPTANRLLVINQENAFSLIKKESGYYNFSGLELEVAEHKLGRGIFKASNVVIVDRYLNLISPENSFDGAEVRTKDRLGYGSYKIELKTDYAPGSFTAFFLYQDVSDKNDEIDIEIHNDGSQKIDLVTFKAGEKSNFSQKRLDFDPSEDFYEYRIEYYPERIAFYAADKLLVEYTDNLPDEEMKLMVSHWWPDWLEATRDGAKSRIQIRSIKSVEFNE